MEQKGQDQTAKTLESKSKGITNCNELNRDKKLSITILISIFSLKLN